MLACSSVVTFEQAFVRTRPEAHQSIKDKLERYLDEDVQPDVLPELTVPESAALRSAQERMEGREGGWACSGWQ